MEVGGPTPTTAPSATATTKDPSATTIAIATTTQTETCAMPTVTMSGWYDLQGILHNLVDPRPWHST